MIEVLLTPFKWWSSSRLCILGIRLKRAMLSSLDKQIQLEEEEILKLFNQLEQSM